jgi:hypothetical protein
VANDHSHGFIRNVEASINTSWDFENVWTICEGKDHPRLRREQVAHDEQTGTISRRFP